MTLAGRVAAHPATPGFPASTVITAPVMFRPLSPTEQGYNGRYPPELRDGAMRCDQRRGLDRSWRARLPVISVSMKARRNCIHGHPDTAYSQWACDVEQEFLEFDDFCPDAAASVPISSIRVKT